MHAMCSCSLSKHIGIKILQAGFIVIIHVWNWSQGKRAVTDLILRRIFGAWGMRKYQDIEEICDKKEHHNFYPPLNIIRMINELVLL